MAKRPLPQPSDTSSEHEAGSPESAYEPPPELDAPPPLLERDEAMPLPSEDFELVRPGRSAAFKLAVGAAAAAVLAGGLLAYRHQHRKNLVAAGLVQASRLLRADTAASYREAASLLEPLAQIDPVEAGAARAFALGMLFLDYGDPAAEGEAEALLVAPDRADRVPAYASLAAAAVSLGRSEAGTATAALAAVPNEPWGNVLLARTALLAGNAQVAAEPAAAAAAADPRLAAALALNGDMLRRVRKDAPAARAAYEAALAVSPLHARAAYGLAKLAVAGDAPVSEAAAPLQRIFADARGTPAPERARAALHLAALSLRAGDRARANAALDAVRLDARSRVWAERAAAFAVDSGRELHAYRALEGAPAALRTSSDDDPGMAAPPPPPPAPAHAAKPARKPTSHLAKGKPGASKPAAKKARGKTGKAGAKKSAVRKKS